SRGPHPRRLRPARPASAAHVTSSDGTDDIHRVLRLMLARLPAPASRAVLGRAPGRSAPDEAARRVLQDAGDVGQHARAELAVDEAVVEAEGELRDPALLDLPLVDPRLLADRAEGEYRRLARVEDGRPRVDAEHADVRDGDRAVGHVGGRRPARA